MTWIIDNLFKTAALDGALDIFDLGSTDPSGDVQLLNNIAQELALIILANPAFAPATMNGALSNAVANPSTDDVTVTAGDIAQIKIRDRNNVTRLDGTVGVVGSGADIILSSVTIPPGAEYVGLEGLTFAFAWSQ